MECRAFPQSTLSQLHQDRHLLISRSDEDALHKDERAAKPTPVVELSIVMLCLHLRKT